MPKPPLLLVGQARSGTRSVGTWAARITGYGIAPGQEGRLLNPNHNRSCPGIRPESYDAPDFSGAHEHEQFTMMDRAVERSSEGIIIRISRFPTVARRYAAARGYPLLVLRRDPALIVHSRERVGWGNPAEKLGFENSAFGMLEFCCWMQWRVLAHVSRHPFAEEVCVDEISDCPQLLVQALHRLGMPIVERAFLEEADRQKAVEVRQYPAEERVQKLRSMTDRIRESSGTLPGTASPAVLRDKSPSNGECEDRLAVLIASHNDDYCLNLCIEALVEGAKTPLEIVVLENGSTDQTGAVADWWAETERNVKAYHASEPLAPAEGWNRLAQLTECRHCLFLDSDMVLIERRADELTKIVRADDKPLVKFRFCQFAGDFQHISRENHVDKECQVYVDRQQVPDVRWATTPAGFVKRHTGDIDVQTSRRLWYHLNLVKPDHRLVARTQDRAYFRGDQEKPPASATREDTDAQVHKRALNRLQGSTVKPIEQCDIPPFPRVVERRLPGRFELVRENGELRDRVDHGWTEPWGEYGKYFI